MNKEELRGKFIKEIPKQIIKGEQLSYADWLEKLIVSNYVVNKNDLLQRVMPRSFKERRQTLNMSVDGFTDWNKFTLDQHCEILENEFRFSSSGIAKSVFELIEFYKKHKPSEGNTQLDTESKCNKHGVVCSASIDDVKNGKVIIDMRGSEKWGKKVNRLFEILKQAAPKKEKMPAYSFAPFYFCENGYWYESTWRETGSVPVLDICD